MFFSRFCALVLVTSGLLIPVRAFAQTFTASLQGTVTDSTGAVAPNAGNTLTNEATRDERWGEIGIGLSISRSATGRSTA